LGNEHQSSNIVRNSFSNKLFPNYHSHASTKILEAVELRLLGVGRVNIGNRPTFRRTLKLPSSPWGSFTSSARRENLKLKILEAVYNLNGEDIWCLCRQK